MTNIVSKYMLLKFWNHMYSVSFIKCWICVAYWCILIEKISLFESLVILLGFLDDNIFLYVLLISFQLLLLVCSLKTNILRIWKKGHQLHLPIQPLCILVIILGFITKRVAINPVFKNQKHASYTERRFNLYVNVHILLCPFFKLSVHSVVLII